MNMDYALAKQLKDAGFPQNGRGDTLSTERAFVDEKHMAYFPSLEELVEACGAKFKNFRRKGDGWWADSKHHMSKGKTPTEAVAKLWLALNTQ